VTRASPEAAPPRLAVVWWPDWPVVAAGIPPGIPAAVLHANRVLAASGPARADGVQPGLRRRDAQARCPSLVVLEHDPARDARAFEPVLQALEHLTPLLEHTAPGVCTFAARGPSRYHGGDGPLARRAAAHAMAAVPAMAPPGPAVGIADGRFAATLAARSAVTGDPVVVPPGESAAFLAPFPVAALDRPELADLLVRLGVRRLGHVAALPVADFVARFGAEGRAVHRLASGLDHDPPDARRPPPELVVQHEFEPPVPTAGPVAFVAKLLAEALHERLGALGLACPAVVVLAETEHGEHHERVWRHEGGLRAAAIAERVRWQLEGWAATPEPPTGGITLLRLVPAEVVPDTGRQQGFWGGQTQADERAARTVARLAGLLGPEAVAVPEWRGGREPAATVVAVPAASADLEQRRVASPPDAGPWPGRLPAPSPATVAAEPMPVEVLDAAGCPVKVSGRGAVSAPPAWLRVGRQPPGAVVAWAGPWPCEERWWDPARHRRRARFQLLTDAGTAHLVVVEGGRWWLEATYD
jgi:protein ImuB